MQILRIFGVTGSVLFDFLLDDNNDGQQSCDSFNTYGNYSIFDTRFQPLDLDVIAYNLTTKRCIDPAAQIGVYISKACCFNLIDSMLITTICHFN